MVDLSALNRVNICVIGDIVLDQFCYGKVVKLSPEAPVLVVRAKEEVYALGGAANVALNLRKLGCNVSLCGYVGDDIYGRTVLDLLRFADISTEYLSRCDETIVKTRIIAGDQHVVRYDREKTMVEQNVSTADLQSKVMKGLVSCDGVIFSDYNKGTLLEDIVHCVRSSFNNPIFADHKPNNKHIFHDIYCITPNLFEIQEMFPAITDVRELLKHVKSSMQLKCLLCTMSEQGMVFMDETDELNYISAHVLTSAKKERHHRIDVTGAGDTVIGCFAACVVSGMDALLAVKVSNVAASIVVNKLGTSSCSYDELVCELKACDND